MVKLILLQIIKNYNKSIKKGGTMMNKSECMDKLFDVFSTLNNEDKSLVIDFAKQLVVEEQKNGNNE